MCDCEDILVKAICIVNADMYEDILVEAVCVMKADM